ncbi:hypothetical protein BHYA_0004g01000 [Botrytis hyacinthi]|uniref:Uncharacterized protein n=1 Tax=Botrytis hyacinthi TaxID=278943 RepID=A0A4Z1H182_9HELO|nr:hypothetical protein BHYA_0004g01000 [Botrytis hyacinthi]
MDISSPIRQTTQSLNAAFRAVDLNSLDEPFATQLSNAEFPANSHRPFLQDRKRDPSTTVNNHNEKPKDLHQLQLETQSQKRGISSSLRPP